MIVDYMIVKKSQVRFVEEEVASLLIDGWQPFGSIGCGEHGYIYQPMVKEIMTAIPLPKGTEI